MNANVNPITLPPTSSTEVHDFGESVTFQWLYDGRIPSLSASVMARSTLDRFFDVMLEVIASAPKDRMLTFMIDISFIQSATPYFNSRLTDVKDAVIGADYLIRTALIVPPSSLGVAIFTMVKRIFDKRLPDHVKDEIFKDRQKALNWLMQFLEA